jgi:hypothetical protein
MLLLKSTKFPQAGVCITLFISNHELGNCHSFEVTVRMMMAELSVFMTQNHAVASVGTGLPPGCMRSSGMHEEAGDLAHTRD